MPMIALACFIVVTHQTSTIDNQDQRILQAMARAAHCLGYSPYPQFDEDIVAHHATFPQQQLRLHVVVYTNKLGRALSCRDAGELRVRCGLGPSSGTFPSDGTRGARRNVAPGHDRRACTVPSSQACATEPRPRLRA